MSKVRLYFRLLGISLRGQMQYRVSFLLQAIGQLIFTGVEFFGIWALFQRFGSLRGWTLPEVALTYGMVNVAFGFAEGFGRGFDIFPALVKSGDFDRLLLRPRSTALQIAGQELQIMRVGRLVQGGSILCWAIYSLGFGASPGTLLLIGFAIAGGICLFYGLFIVQATIAFWTVESLEIMNTVTYGGTETGQYPMSIYRPWFRQFFTFVIPLACVTYFPAGVLLGRTVGTPELWLGCIAPLAGLLFLLISLRIWQFGVRHYRSTGS